MANFPTSPAPSYGARKTSSPKTRITRFGDGYEKRQNIGLNQNPKEWNLTFKNILETEADTIETFLNDRADDNQSFSWIPSDLARWAASTAYSIGDIVQPLTAQNNGLVYKVTQVGGSSPYTSGSSEPTWGSGTSVDNELAWSSMSYQWVCDSWTKTIPYNNRATIQATFRQVFEP